MKLFFKGKDGGPESKVTGYWLIESKRFFSIALLKFDEGSREAYHTHAFNAVSWVLWGELLEEIAVFGDCVAFAPRYRPSIFPIFTPKDRYHKVTGIGKRTWALTLRGPWDKQWKEYLPSEDKEITLTNGRVVVDD